MYSAPKNFEIRYNFGQFLLLEFQNSEKAHQELEVARDLDQYRFTMYSEHLRGGTGTIDIPLNTLVLLKRLFTPDFLAAATGVAEEIWASGLRFKNAWYFSIACGVLFVLNLFLESKRAYRNAGSSIVRCVAIRIFSNRKSHRSRKHFAHNVPISLKRKRWSNLKNEKQKLSKFSFVKKVEEYLRRWHLSASREPDRSTTAIRKKG